MVANRLRILAGTSLVSLGMLAAPAVGLAQGYPDAMRRRGALLDATHAEAHAGARRV